MRLHHLTSLRTPRTATEWALRLVVSLLLCGVLWGGAALVLLATGVGPNESSLAALAFASLVVSALSTYVVWPSRWNVWAHIQLAFALVAYFIPIVLLNDLARYERDTVLIYTQIIALGAMATLAGTVLGGWISHRDRVRAALSRVGDRARALSGTVLPLRTLVVSLAAIILVVVAFAVMGFIPALAADPLSAKFFRGEYQDAYAPVAIPYRAGTAVLSAALPLLTMFALWRRKTVWIITFAAATSVLLLTLQREPAVSGILLAIGIAVAMRKRGMWLYIAVLVGIYFVGSAAYAILEMLGIGNFASTDASSANILVSVAAGAPDVADHVNFLHAWLASPIAPGGRTFFGGLIPGSYEWNPAVFTLAVTNPGADVTQIASGGFRLPTAVWGFVNFSWFGAIAVPFALAVLAGIAAGVAATYFSPTASRDAGANARTKALGLGVAFLLYTTTADLISQGAALSYVTVIQAAMIFIVALAPRFAPLEPKSTPL